MAVLTIAIAAVAALMTSTMKMAVKVFGTAAVAEMTLTIKMAVLTIGMAAVDLMGSMTLPITVLNTSRPP